MKRALLTAALLGCMIVPVTASADVGAGIRVSSFGFSGDLDIGASKWITVKVGYSGINYGREVTDTDVRYDGRMSINAATAIIDWNVFAGGLHLSAGAVSGGPKVDVTGTPTNGTYTFNGTTYQADDIAALNGTIVMGNGVAPYFGLGWGNVVGSNHSLTLLFDLGAIHTGAAKATLNVTCNASVPSATCDQIISDANAEKADLENKAGKYRWYPVVSIGLGIKF